MANQVTSTPYVFQIFGDGSSTSVSFDLDNVPSDPAQNNILESSNPDSIYLISFTGSPTPLPNITSLTVSGSVVTVEFDSALTAINLTTQDGMYELSFWLGFNS